MGLGDKVIPKTQTQILTFINTQHYLLFYSLLYSLRQTDRRTQTDECENVKPKRECAYVRHGISTACRN